MSISVLTKITYRVLITSWEVLRNTGKTSRWNYWNFPVTIPRHQPKHRELRHDSNAARRPRGPTGCLKMSQNGHIGHEQRFQNVQTWYEFLTAWHFKRFLKIPKCQIPQRSLVLFQLQDPKENGINRRFFYRCFVDCKLNQHNDYHGNSDVFTPPLSKISGFFGASWTVFFKISSATFLAADALG